MNNTDTILKLKEDQHYYGEFGRQFLSNSDIGTLISNPKKFGVPSEKTVEMLKGSYFHTLALEPHKAKNLITVDASTRTTNIYKNALAETGEDILLLSHEVEDIKFMVAALKANKDLSSLVYSSINQYEMPFIGEIFGVPFKCKVDIHRLSEKNYDLKTTSSIDEFKWSAKKYNYDSQAWIYRELTGYELEFIVIEKGTNRLGHFIPTDEFYQSGQNKVELALSNYNRFFSVNSTDDINQYYVKNLLF